MFIKIIDVDLLSVCCLRGIAKLKYCECEMYCYPGCAAAQICQNPLLSPFGIYYLVNLFCCLSLFLLLSFHSLPALSSLQQSVCGFCSVCTWRAAQWLVCVHHKLCPTGPICTHRLIVLQSSTNSSARSSYCVFLLIGIFLVLSSAWVRIWSEHCSP